MNKVLNRGVSYTTPNVKSKRIKHRALYVLSVLSGLGLLGTIIAALLIIFVFTAFSSTLPSPTKLTSRDIEQTTKIYDRNGELLYTAFDNKNRTLVTLDNVSPYVISGTLSAEDAEFYKHQGIDPLSIARSVYVTLTGDGKQGGSTITQQVAKNALLTLERTVQRKIKDVVLALQIENTYTKDEILQMYLNEVPYGGTIYGIEEAANQYFNKSASELTLAESALLAGLPQSPTRYSPYADPEAAKNRQKYVLRLMKENGWIGKDGVHYRLTEEEYEQAINENLVYKGIQGEIKAPHFVMYVLSVLREKYGEDLVDKGGLSVTTTLDYPLHEEMQRILREEVEQDSSKRLGFTNAGLIAIDPQNGQILSMVGSKDYFAEDIDGQFNVALGMRQPGSALKPITYLAGLTQGYTASTVIYDVYTEFSQGEGRKPYTPKNYGNWGFRGPIQVRYALANSVNITAVKMLDLVGIDYMVKLANNMGIKSLYYDPSKHGLAITLGGVEVPLLELTNGFATIANKGVYHEATPIMEVKMPSGEILESANTNMGTQVVDENNVWIITDILSDNSARSQAFTSNSELNIPNHKVAVKTGTSNDLKDNWTVGFTDEITIGVWVGNNDGSEMNQNLASGVTGAAPIWNTAMTYFLKDHPHPEFPKPDGVVSAWVGTESGMMPSDDSEGRRMEYFVEGSEPKAKSTIYQRVKVCKDGNVEDRTYTVYREIKDEWQPYVESWVRGRWKDDETEMYKHLDPDYDKSRDPDKFDIDDCKDDDDDDDDD